APQILLPESRSPATRSRHRRPAPQRRLQLLSLAVVLVVVVAVAEGVHDVCWVEAGGGVLQPQAHSSQLHLDLVDRLLTEVADVEEVRLGPADQLADGVDALALEAVVG